MGQDELAGSPRRMLVPTRVVYLHHDALLFGGGSSLLTQLDALDRHRWEPIVLVPCHGPLVDAVVARKVRVVIEPSVVPESCEGRRVWVTQAVRLSVALHRLQPGIVDLNQWSSWLDLSVVAIAAWWAGARLVVHLRGNLGYGGSMLRRYERFCLSRADHVVCCSDFVRRTFCELAGGYLLQSSTVSVIYEGHSVESFRRDGHDLQTLRFELGFSRAAPVVAFVGMLDTAKRPELFVEASALVHRRRPDVRFILVGDAFPGRDGACYRQSLMALVAQLGLDGVVVFTGHRSDVPAIMQLMDLLVLPSRTEAFGRVLAEAQITGRPVVAAAVDGIPEVVIDGETGVLVRDDTPEAYARAMLMLLDHPEVARRMGERGRQWATRQFDIRRTVVQLEHVYVQVLDAGSRRIDRRLACMGMTAGLRVAGG